MIKLAPCNVGHIGLSSILVCQTYLFVRCIGLNIKYLCRPVWPVVPTEAFANLRCFRAVTPGAADTRVNNW